MVQLGCPGIPLDQAKLVVEVLFQLRDGGCGRRRGSSRAQGARGVAVLLVPQVLAAAGQRGLDVRDTLSIGHRDERRRRQGRGGDHQEDQVAGQGGRPAPAPLPPALDRAPIRDAVQGQVIQMPPQIGRQRRRVAVALARVGAKALVDQVREADGDLRILLAEPRARRARRRGRPASASYSSTPSE